MIQDFANIRAKEEDINVELQALKLHTEIMKEVRILTF
jgi:hypothetical protein